MAIFHLAKANILKNKSNSITLAMLVLVVAMLTTVGLTVLTQVNSAFDRRADELVSAHYLLAVSKNDYDKKYETYLQNDPRVTGYEIGSSVLMVGSNINFGGGFDSTVMLLDKTVEHTISPLKILEEDTTVSPKEAIYLPYYGKMVGYNIGDAYTVTYKNKKYNFVVAGFFEAVDLSRTSGICIKHFVSHEAFENFKDEIGESVLMTMRIADTTDILKFIRDFRDGNEIETDSIIGSETVAGDYQSFKLPNIMPIILLAGVVVGFALITVLISLIVINFRVVNSIEDRMRNIGVLGATGYTSTQLLISFLIEYGLVSLPASLCGVAMDSLLGAGINNLILTMTGLHITVTVQVGLGIASAVIISILLASMVLIAGYRVKKLPPVVALRGGLATHSFRRNFFRLDKGFGPVNLRLALKNMFAYKKLYIMIGTVLTGVALVVTFVTVTYINFAVDQTAFIKMVGVEVADVAVSVTEGTDANRLADEIAKMPDVRKVGMLDFVGFKVEGIDVLGNVTDDFSQMENISPFKGTSPVLDNEIAVPESFAKGQGKQIGDMVSVKKDGIVKDFIICGYFSTTNNGGNVAHMTLEGYRRIEPGYLRHGVNVYLKDGITFDDFSEKLQQQFGVVNVFTNTENDKFSEAKARAEEKISTYLERYGINSVEYAVSYNGEIILKGSSSSYQIAKITNWGEYMETQINSFASGLSTLLAFVSFISLLLIVLILYMTVKTIIVKRRVELGVLKAGGFQTSQLVWQMAVSFMPSAAIGSMLGCLCGAAMVNPAFMLLFSAMGGISEVNFTVSPVAILVIFVSLCLVTLGISTVSALRIKNISVYELLSE